MQLSVNPEVVHGFETSRRKVVEALSNISFARIVSIVQLPNKIDPKEPHFQGEVEEVFASKYKSTAKHAFFSRFSRNAQGVSVMGCFQIVDTAMGTAHASALPQVGDVLVGSFVEAGRKGKIPYEFKGWCNNGKPLLELSRVLQFGTRMSAKELHTLLRQPASITAAFALRLNSKSISPLQLHHAQQVSQSVDDIWNIARALCFKDIQEDTTLKTSRRHWDMMTQLAMTTLDEDFLEELNKVKPEEEMSQDISGQGYGGYQGQFHSSGPGYTLPQPSDFGRRTPPYEYSRKTPEFGESGGKTPQYTSSSPLYGSSPAFAPSSPIESSTQIESKTQKESKEPLETTLPSKTPNKSSFTPIQPSLYDSSTPLFGSSPQSPLHGSSSPPFIPLPMPALPTVPSQPLSPQPTMSSQPVSFQTVPPQPVSLQSTVPSHPSQVPPLPPTPSTSLTADIEMIAEPKAKKPRRTQTTKSKTKVELKEPEPILYSPQPTVNSTQVYSPSAITSHPIPQVYSPSVPFSPEKSGKTILSNLLAKINSAPLVSYEDI